MNVHNLEIAAMQTLCEDFDTPRSLSVYLMLKYKSHDEYLNMSIDASHYLDNVSFQRDYFVTKFLSKWKGFKTGRNLEADTIASWSASESKCALTNNRIRHSVGLTSRVSSILFYAQRKISNILGTVPSLSTLIDHSGWSKGGTFDLRRGTAFTTKMTSKQTVTRGAYRYMATAIGSDPVWCESIGLDVVGPCTLHSSNFVFVRGNKHTMVPKNAKIHRNISIEPTANIYLQKGVGSVLRRKLARVGVNLNDQTLNQELAKIAQKANLCTVDLSSASDTISKQLVLSLLPIDWYLLLDDLRSKTTQVGDKVVHLEKFSSQGNGFTFELESILFYAITTAVNEYLGLSNFFTNVYGDDIITNAEAYDVLVEVLTYCGFEVNLDKSYSSGSFFESCGKHYFNGEDVTPVYQKEISNKREEVIRLHNRIYRWHKRTDCLSKDFIFTYIRREFYKFFKDKYEPRIPGHSVSDDGFLVSLDNLNSYCVNLGWRCTVYRFTTRLKRASSELAFYSHKLHHSTTSSSDPKGHCYLSGTDGFYRYAKGWYHY